MLWELGSLTNTQAQGSEKVKKAKCEQAQTLSEALLWPVAKWPNLMRRFLGN